MTSAKDLIKRAMSWGMKSIAITDHGVVQAFPEAHKMLGYDNPDMKILYGVEAYLAPDKNPVVENGKGQYLEDVTYYVLDLETTGFSAVTEKITEIGIMKVKDGEMVDDAAPLIEHSIYPSEILAIKGPEGVYEYLIQEVQKVYRNQGVDINEKHIELIARKMIKKVRVEDNGATD